MAADTRSETAATERFEDVDWDDVGGLGFPRRTLALGVSSLAYLVAVVYDVFLTEDALVSGTNWLFLLTLLAGVFFVAWPLAENRRLTAYYWRRFKKNRAAVISAIYLLVVFVLGTFGPMLIAKPELNVLAAYQPPVFLSVDSSVPTSCVGQAADGLCHGTWKYPLGTTSDGKGIARLVVFGMRVSMQVGLITMLIVISIGTVVGTSAAYFSGLVDELLMRYVDIQQTFPTFFLFLIVTYLFKPSLFLLITIFGFLGWGGIARLVRSEALQRREESYIQAAENAGASDGWIIRRHLMPNVSNTVITAATLLIPSFILFEATFAFLGLTDPSTPSWGQVISSGRGDLDSAWWIATIPGVFLFFTVLAFNFVGDALRDALDPRSEGDA
ncbi:ABC transporter permease [Haloferax larsenii]|uniref:ABC transporter permease n=1 Tax=Haloferax larsenii TaxID=302484 RepID=A0ABY5RA96_HALLR|nr:ABC transporter permease [Haloferax larsenii]ELZ84359.1 ABC-type transport system permease [Haloferax larsenii JCM 13917]UVE49261.1 ABC transporter permease [Haloferax larsenii]